MKRFIFYLTFLLFIQFSWQSEKHLKTYKNKFHKGRFSKARVHTKEEPEKNIEYIDKVDFDAQLSKNVEAQKVFDTVESKNGRDEAFPSSVEEEFFVLVVEDEGFEKFTVPIGQMVPVKKMVRINQYTLSYGSVADSYRGIEGGFEIEKLIGSDDNPIEGRCCEGIMNVFKEKFQHANKVQTFFCFTVETQEESLKICSEEEEDVAKFRKKLILTAIKGFYKKRGFGNVNILIPKSDEQQSWSWNDQATWPPLCKKGAFQSPIDLDPGRSVDTLMTISFIFKTIPKISSFFNEHEKVFSGDLGKMIHKLEIGVRDFIMSSYTMKFPSEHKVNGKGFDGEILVSIASKDVNFL